MHENASGAATAPGGDVGALRAEMTTLMEQRKALEAEIEQIAARLNAPGQPGARGSLVDKEGYPRADIDVHAVRTDRQRLICLSNDHKQLTSRIEQQLYALHAAARQAAGVSNGTHAAGPTAAPAAPTPAAAPAGSTAMPAATTSAQQAAMATAAAPAAAATAGLQVEAPAARPFALVDEVTTGSPAAAAGIQLGDQLCRFGDVAGGSGGISSSELLTRVAGVLGEHEGRPVEMLLLRAGLPVTVQLVPRRWDGRGLLGCHMRPLG